jgi:lysophospholipase
VLIAPLLGMANMPLGQTGIRRLSGFLRMIGLGGMYLAGGPRPRETKPFPGNKLTSDEKRYRRNSVMYEEHPELALGGPTATWVNASCRAIDKITTSAFKAQIQIPTLIIAAGADQIVSNGALEQFVRGLRSGAMVTVDGARHEILQEADFYRDQVLAAFDAFIPGSDETNT